MCPLKVIGIAGPANLESLEKYFPGKCLPKGLGGMVLPHLIDGFIHTGYQVVLFTLDKNVTEPVMLEGENIRIWIGPYRPRHHARDLFAFERQHLTRAIQEESVDVVHAHWTYEFALAAIDSGKPALVTAHDAPLKVLLYDLTPYRFMRTLMALKVARKARFLTAVSDYIAGHFREIFRYRGELHVVPNGIKVAGLGIKNAKTDSSALIFASTIVNWHRMRNPKTLLKAFKIVFEKFPQSELWLFGLGFEPNGQAEQWARRNQLSKNVRFYGFVPNQDLLQILSREVDVFVLPSLEESFSMSILEAMVSGLPIIAGKHSGGVPYTLGYGKAGLLVDVRNPLKLAQAMLSMAGSSELRDGLGKAAYEYARLHYDIEIVVKAYERIYLTLYQNKHEGFAHSE